MYLIFFLIPNLFCHPERVAEGSTSYLLKTLCIVLGLVCVALAALGAVLPLLPATPFLLLALWLFARSSSRLERWLISNRLFGRYLDNYRRGLGVPLAVKIGTLSLLLVTISLSAIYATSSWGVRALLFAVAIGVTIHILSIKTCKRK